MAKVWYNMGNMEVQEAITIVAKLLNDINERIRVIQLEMQKHTQRVKHTRERTVYEMLPDFSTLTLSKLKENYPKFANSIVVTMAFEANKQKSFLGLFKRVPKTYESELSLLQLKFNHWLSENVVVNNSLPDELLDYVNRQKHLTELLTNLKLVQKSNRPLTEKLRNTIEKIRNMSYNYSDKHRTGWYDDVYFEEDWSGIFDLATELFIVYEAFQSEALAEEVGLIPEEIDNSTNIEPEPTIIYSTDDSLGYYS